MPTTEEVAVLQQGLGGPLHPHSHLRRLQDQNLVSGKLEPGRQNKMWHTPCELLTNNVHPPLIKMIKYSFCHYQRNVLCTSGMRRNNRIKQQAALAGAEWGLWAAGALGERVERKWCGFGSCCSVYTQYVAGVELVTDCYWSTEHSSTTSMSAEWFSDSPLPFLLHCHSHLCK